MYCCCMKLESVGFPCRHIFAVMKYANMKGISSSCILWRWPVCAKEQIALNEDSTTHEEDSGLFDGKRKVKDPLVVNVKGAPKGKRVQTCDKCRGTGHTRHTCSKNVNAKAVFGNNVLSSV